MKNSLSKKVLVLGIILLFIGISFAPSVSSIEFTKNNTSNNGDLVEITLQLCKSDGVEDHKMFITQEQDEQLDRLIESFKADLDNAETREETIEIYNDMVVSLDELGILPESTSCIELQELVTGENSISNPVMKSNKHFNQAYERLKNKNSEIFKKTNMFCLISGETTRTKITQFFGTLHSISLILRALLFQLLTDIYPDAILIYLIANFFTLRLGCWSEIYKSINTLPLKLGGFMTLGRREYDPWEGRYEYYPATGWVNTIGLTGIKTWTDSIYGQIYWGLVDRGLGITGFTGLHIIENNFYQGAALWVKLGSNPP